MSDRHAAHAAPTWFGGAALAALLWEVIGGVLLVNQAVTVPDNLAADQLAIWNATPLWMHGAFAFAVVTGLAGTLLLLMRKRRADPVLLVSLLAFAAHFTGILIVPQLRNLVASDDLLMPFVVVVGCYAVWHLARLARRSGWLR